jgi:hypothetical protein
MTPEKTSNKLIQKEIHMWRNRLLFEERIGESEQEKLREGFWLAGVLYGLRRASNLSAEMKRKK